ncbi:MAG: PQQ-dependent sugar dehydrogenase [Hoeflea sp.]|nr:PQQ-dependent sugar dehydrogenase [Alphaproteobacteria bacterium]MBV1725476.1 PQQ-dependent sugar dehydrogenase [Hoeflea sp.]MBU4547017.1 PQQ-dependent sugar dehydrogenase [Alphaproteobacteria bacterium]MBU4551471.1 PQQ-dependent sugar dehydrogenase [Alphaproteobacteria bacterium]MBV1759524.1 PQQ-dependent sugar dehydrogenase [Hoeflea sp.]
MPHTPNRPKRFIAVTCFAMVFVMTVIGSVVARDTILTQEVSIDVEVLASGLDHPWGIEPLPEGGLLVTERSGALRLVRDGEVSAPISGVPEVAARGQGGLLDIALARDFATSRTLFLSYSARGGNGMGTAIARARLSDDATALTDVEEIFRMNRFSGAGQHFGSRIAVAEDGTLFFTIGDRGESERAQDPNDHAGSVLRIAADGSIPADNPFASGGGAPEIWSTGHRNPQGMDIDPKTGVLYAVEHGARGGDEVNLPEAGRNYGWPVISYGRHYSGAEIGQGTAADGMEQPIHYWDPSIAPGGMAVYRGEMFPEWDGDLLVAALKFQLLVRLDLDAETGEVLSEERMLKGDYGRIRDVHVAPDGAVLMVTDEDNGQILRLSRTPDTD